MALFAIEERNELLGTRHRRVLPAGLSKDDALSRLRALADRSRRFATFELIDISAAAAWRHVATLRGEL